MATQMEQYRTEGYFIANHAVDPDMLDPLLEAARRIKERSRSGEVDIAVQWAAPGEPWVIRGLFSLAFGESIFAEYLVSRPLMDYVESFLDNDLPMGDVVLFTNPRNEDFSTGWHRDMGDWRRYGSEEVELAFLNQPMTSIKWHLALVDDACLMLVSGSHRRFRTANEEACMRLSDDYRQYLSQDRPPGQVPAPEHPDIPGQKVIELKAGQTVFWTGNTIHRGGHEEGCGAHDAGRELAEVQRGRFPQRDRAKGAVGSWQRVCGRPCRRPCAPTTTGGGRFRRVDYLTGRRWKEMKLNEMWDMGELIDLSADIYEGMAQMPPPVFPAVEVRELDLSERAKGREYVSYSQAIHMPVQVATYLETGAHLYPEMEKINEVGLERLFVSAVVLQIPRGAGEKVTAPDIESKLKDAGETVNPGEALLIGTGYNFFEDPDFKNTPHFRYDAVEWAVQPPVRHSGV